MNSGNALTGGLRNVILGDYNGLDLTEGYSNTLIGHAAGNTASGSGNVSLGYNAGGANTGDGNVFLGRGAGLLSGPNSDRLYIANSGVDSSDALIYGEFLNDFIRLNARVFMRDGWSDSDGDTKIRLDNGMDDDTIRMDIGGVEMYRFSKNANGNALLNISGGTLNDVFIGNQAGVLNTDNNYDGHVFIGNKAGMSNTYGDSNVFIGGEAGMSNAGGYENVYIGADAGQAMQDGNVNVFIGCQT